MDANFAKIVNVGKCNNFDTADGQRTRTIHHKQMNSDLIGE